MGRRKGRKKLQDQSVMHACSPSSESEVPDEDEDDKGTRKDDVVAASHAREISYPGLVISCWVLLPLTYAAYSLIICGDPSLTAAWCMVIIIAVLMVGLWLHLTGRLHATHTMCASDPPAARPLIAASSTSGLSVPATPVTTPVVGGPPATTAITAKPTAPAPLASPSSSAASSNEEVVMDYSPKDSFKGAMSGAGPSRPSFGANVALRTSINLVGQGPTVVPQQRSDPQFLASNAAQLLQDIKAALSASKGEANKAVAVAEHELAAMDTGVLPLALKLGRMKVIVTNVTTACKMLNRSIDAQDSRFDNFLQRIEALQKQMDESEFREAEMDSRLDALAKDVAKMSGILEKSTAQILMGQGACTFAYQLQNYVFEDDPRATSMPPMYVKDIITQASAVPWHWRRCKEVLTFAHRTAGITQVDLETTDGFLRGNCLDFVHGTDEEKEATSLQEMIRYARMMYPSKPWKAQNAIRLFQVLACFSSRQKPLDPDLPIGNVVR